MNCARFLVVVVLALGVSGCPANTCSETSCDGCCANGECLGGRSRYTCGLGGVECTSCAATELCTTKGRCEPDLRLDQDSGMALCACGTGCCLADGGCVVGTQREACGAPRSLCRVCDVAARCEKLVCTSAACSGCIDLTNVCQPGTAETACGTNGKLCLGCSSGQRCSEGACVDAPCNVSSCATGCCSIAQLCVRPLVSSCGIGGQSCVNCPSGTTACTNGVCQ